MNYIVFEGSDGAGKSTLRGLLYDWMISKSFKVLVIGQHSWLDVESAKTIIEVRENLKTHSPEAIAKAYFRDKYLHSRKSVRLALENEFQIISDRSFISDAVYLDVLYGIDWQVTLHEYLDSDIPFPDIIINPTVPHDEAYRRILLRSKSIKHFEKPASLETLNKIYAELFDYLQKEKQVKILNFDNSKEGIESRFQQEILPNIVSHMKPHNLSLSLLDV